MKTPSEQYWDEEIGTAGQARRAAVHRGLATLDNVRRLLDKHFDAGRTEITPDDLEDLYIAAGYPVSEVEEMFDGLYGEPNVLS